MARIISEAAALGILSMSVVASTLAGVASADPMNGPMNGLNGPMTAARQLVTVRGHGWNDRSAELQRWERQAPSARWTRVGKELVVVLGAHGLGWGAGLVSPTVLPGEPRKKEGDLRSPAGLFRLGTVTGYAAQPPAGTSLPYRAAPDERLRCVDDGKSPAYNQLAEAPATGKPAWRSDEKMHRGDGLYELTVFVEHNAERTVGAGSCIFLHIWSSPTGGTAGCTAMPRDDLFTLVGWLRPGALLLQAPQTAWDRLAAAAGVELGTK